jgi:hypothetical protein
MSSTPNKNSIEHIKQIIDDNLGLQRSNRYAVSCIVGEVGTIIGMPSTFEMYPSTLSFGARAIDYIHDGLPGYGYGRMVPKSGKFIGGVVMTFAVLQNQQPIDWINNWFDYIYGSNKSESGTNIGFTVPYYNNLIGPAMFIRFLDLNGNQNSQWTLTEFYPVECMPLELSAKTDQFLTYQIVFNYRQIKRTGTGSDTP